MIEKSFKDFFVSLEPRRHSRPLSQAELHLKTRLSMVGLDEKTSILNEEDDDEEPSPRSTVSL